MKATHGKPAQGVSLLAHFPVGGEQKVEQEGSVGAHRPSRRRRTIIRDSSAIVSGKPHRVVRAQFTLGDISIVVQFTPVPVPERRFPARRFRIRDPLSDGANRPFCEQVILRIYVQKTHNMRR